MVVCVKKTGHVAIEAINIGCCGHSTNYSESVQLEGVKDIKPQFDENDICQSCVDIPISTSGIVNYHVSTRNSTPDNGVSVYINNSSYDVFISLTEPEHSSFSESTNEIQSLALLHTTVQLN